MFRRGGGLFAELDEQSAADVRRDVYYHSPGNLNGVKLRGEGSGREQLECKLLVERKKRGCEKYKKKVCATLEAVAEMCGKNKNDGALFDEASAKVISVEKVVHKAWLPAGKIPRAGPAAVGAVAAEPPCAGDETPPRRATGPTVLFERTTLTAEGATWQSVCIEAEKAKDVYAGVGALFFGLPTDDWDLGGLPDGVLVGGYPIFLEHVASAPI